MTTSRNLDTDEAEYRFKMWLSEQCKEYMDIRNARFQLDAIDQMFVCLKQ